MSNPADRLYVRPHFHDVLGGEFPQPSDTLRRTHTLGRLAYAAVANGDREIVELGDGAYALYRYSPSWAPTVVAKIDCEFEDPDEGPLTLRALDLTTHAAILYVADENYDGPQNVHIGTIPEDRRYALNSDESVRQARLLVAEAAQAFFEAAT